MPAHPHAELMALYAKDATETDKPWEQWEWFDPILARWVSATSFLCWSHTIKYRRKPKRPWYRVALFKTLSTGFVTLTQDSKSETQQDFENVGNFVKWLTDRVYYDVE